MIYWGLFIFSIILIRNGLNRENDDIFGTGIFFFVVSLILIVITPLFVFNVPAKMQSQYISLSEQQKFIQRLPDPPINEVPFGTSNFELAENIVNQKINFWDKVEKYNENVIFWRINRNLDLIIWGYPRIAPYVNKLPIISGGH